jgi:hypothetical protein
MKKIKQLALTGQIFMDRWPETHVLERGNDCSPTEVLPAEQQPDV